MKNKNAKLVILITLIIASMISFFNMDLSTSPVGGARDGKRDSTENDSTAEILLMPEIYTADLPNNSFCYLDIKDVDTGTNIMDGFSGPRGCQKIHTETYGSEEKSNIYYKGLSGVVIEERVRTSQANNTLNSYQGENKYLVDFDVYKDRNIIYLKMIFADNEMSSTANTKLITGKKLNDFKIEIYQNRLLNFIPTNIGI